MSFKRTLAMLLAMTMLLVNGVCVPAWAEEAVQEAAEAQPAEAAPAPEPEPAPAPEPEPAPAPEPVKEEAPAPAPAPEPAKAEEPPKAEEPAKAEEPPKAEEPAKAEESPKAEEPTKAEEPAKEPEKAESNQEAPTQESNDPGDAPIHSEDTPDSSDQGGDAAPETNADSGETEAPADTGATNENEAPDDGAVNEAPQETASEPAAETEAPASENEAPAPTPAEITSLSADKDTVMLGESAGFSFSVRGATRLRYRVVDPSGAADSGALATDAGHHAFTANKEGRYTFELTATGESGAEVSASASVNAINAPALTLSVKPNAPSCHGGDQASFTLSVTEGLELSKTEIKAALGGKVFYQSGEFTPSLTVDVPAKGKVSEVSVTLSVTDIYGRTAEKSATIPCAVHDPESRAHWEATMKGVKKTGVWPDDLIAIAKTQIGYKESSKDFGPKYDGGISGYTRYGDWAGMPYEEWCAMFACFCLHYAGIEEEDFPYAANCQRWINRLKKVNLYAARSSYTPKVGDLAFFDWQNDNDSDHVGIIFELDYDDDGEVKGVRTIEGNSKGAAVYDGKYYSINDGTMIGYGLVNRAYGHKLEKQHRDLYAEYEGFSVAAGVEPEAKVPAFAELNVREILPGDEGYDQMLNDLRGRLTEGELGYARFLQIGFVDEDGSDVAVQAPVALNVTFNKKMVGSKDFVPGVASMSNRVEINTDVTLERKKQSCAFGFTQDVTETLCLFATGTLDYRDGALKSTQGNQSANVSYTAEAMVPDGAELDFHEIEPASGDAGASGASGANIAYDACVAMMGEAMPKAEDATVRFYAVDVTFNGMPVRPAVPVAVTIKGDQKASDAELVRVKDGAELVCQTSARKGGKLAVDFNADRFGIFAVEYDSAK